MILKKLNAKKTAPEVPERFFNAFAEDIISLQQHKHQAISEH